MFFAQNPDYALIILGFFLLVAFPVHELCHAIAAWRLGDDTAQRQGYLTLNPIKHLHPIGGSLLIISTLLYGFPFGYAATPVNPSRLRGRYGEAIVALAGPLSNWITAIALGLVLRYMVHNVDAPIRLFNLVEVLTRASLALGLFNLLPVPPLDGGAIVVSLLPARTRYRIEPTIAQFSWILLIVVIFFGGYLIGPLVERLFRLLVGV
ncbi:MAG: site-2 protease family protein [Chloroflexota bacterium]